MPERLARRHRLGTNPHRVNANRILIQTYAPRAVNAREDYRVFDAELHGGFEVLASTRFYFRCGGPKQRESEPCRNVPVRWVEFDRLGVLVLRTLEASACKDRNVREDAVCCSTAGPVSIR